MYAIHLSLQQQKLSQPVLCLYRIFYKNISKPNIHIWSIIFWHNHHDYHHTTKETFPIVTLAQSEPCKSLKTALFLCSILNLRAWKHEPSWAWWSSSFAGAHVICYTSWAAAETQQVNVSTCCKWVTAEHT